MPEITEAEWLAELDALGLAGPQDEGATTEELAAKTGHSTKWVRQRLKRAKAEGILIVGWSLRETVDRRQARVPVYSFKRNGA